MPDQPDSPDQPEPAQPAQPRAIVFIDAQNMYHGAIQAFTNHDDLGGWGQFDPMEFSHAIAENGAKGVKRKLDEVRIYTGRPSLERDPAGYRANRRQCQAWENSHASVFTRQLRYPDGWPQEKPVEKGIDVALAIDFVSLALGNQYDVGVIASCDRDLLPALELVYELDGKTVEVAAWSSSTARPQLRIHQKDMWCHWFNEEAYLKLRDRMDYSTGKNFF